MFVKIRGLCVQKYLYPESALFKHRPVLFPNPFIEGILSLITVRTPTAHTVSRGVSRL